ncbi:arsenical pump-driving ATPase [Erysipelothrix sp. HDW6B]|uniref:arsenical pump-driving ATPase n=1 Tax=Erysipelothrix sp. HDW6B TaxID=2714929 RepID=UPI00196ABCD3|nr:arsenical pump-driving ATPase [Erysipelothrix sp. HDW6B]
MIEKFDPSYIKSKYTFFTGKGGVGKTTIACSTAINLAKNGENVLLISTDPASNLQDVFGINLSSKPTKSEIYKNLHIVNLDPEQAAEDYRASVITPYINLLPSDVISDMEEQLSGSCTTEIAAFNEFTEFLTNEEINKKFDKIIFDTAPTGHTLRMLELPSAWNSFIDESTHGASCLGQLSGLDENREKYSKSVDVLKNESETTLVLVTRPEETPMVEAERSSKELRDIDITNQILIINGVMQTNNDDLEKSILLKQQRVLDNVSTYLKEMKSFFLPLKSSSIYESKDLENFYTSQESKQSIELTQLNDVYSLNDLIDDLDRSNKKIIFTMGKGGVGKTTIASSIALELSKRGKKVVLTTTDPANHLKYVIKEHENLSIVEIDENNVLEKYKNEVLNTAKNELGNADLDYIEEDLRSPCTQEIAVFREFAEIVDRSNDEIIVIDTAPTGHTLLLLESAESYDKEMKNVSEHSRNSISRLLPKLKDKLHTEVIIVSLAEATPYYEANRLEKDLKRAGIFTNWWLINASIARYSNLSTFMQTKQNNERRWVNKVLEVNRRKVAVTDWQQADINEGNLSKL